MDAPDDLMFDIMSAKHPGHCFLFFVFLTIIFHLGVLLLDKHVKFPISNSSASALFFFFFLCYCYQIIQSAGFFLPLCLPCIPVASLILTSNMKLWKVRRWGGSLGTPVLGVRSGNTAGFLISCVSSV